MEMQYYQGKAKSFDVGAKNPKESILVHICGLPGEVGEVMELIKKWKRDGTIMDRSKLVKEFGDVLWYIAVLADDFGIGLEEIATTNIVKLSSRKDRGALGGSGDNR